jgi:hypothetical protein
MKSVVLAALFAAAAACTVRAAELPAAFVDPYLRVQEKLAADKVDGIAADASQMASAAAGLGAPAKTLSEASEKLGRAADVKKAREAFGQVSDALFAYMKSAGATKPANVKAAFCPMAKHAWLQKNAKIQNPYYGSEMLECGEFTK